MYYFYLFKNKRGVILYLTLVVIAVLLSIGLAISTILLGEIRIVKGMGDSIMAFFAADSGVEKALDVLYEGGTGVLPFSYSGSVGGAQYSVQGFPANPPSPDCSNPPNQYFCIKSVGIYRGVRRAVDVSR